MSDLPGLRYYYDTEFIDTGHTIDLISIGMVCEDGRAYYAQCCDADFLAATDWVYRNVYPHLDHFYLRGERSCRPANIDTFTGNGSCATAGGCSWRHKSAIKRDLIAFCDPEKYGKPELWAYYGAYDFVALAQIFGPLIDLPKGWPMYAKDIKQWCDALGNPDLPPKEANEHSAFADAYWVKGAWEFLREYEGKRMRRRLRKVEGLTAGQQLNKENT